MANYPIPRTAAAAFERALLDKRPKNAGLVFDRFAPEVISREDRLSGHKDSSQCKKQGLTQVAALPRDQALRSAAYTRWAETVTSNRAHTDVYDFATDWRFVTGVERTSPYEVGFRFDRYGFATLPGTGVKGVVRSFALLEVAEALGPALLNAFSKKQAPGKLADLLLEEKFSKFTNQFPEAGQTAQTLARDFRRMFGHTAEAGLAIFYDAMPKDDPKLELDLINPHYPDYYRTGNRDGDGPSQHWPTNWQSPKPVFFLTVQPGVTFSFAIGWRDSVDDALRTRAKAWLLGGLTEWGAGAKTSAGYGYFEEKSVVGSQASAGPGRAADVFAKPGVGIVTEIDSAKRRRGKLRDAETGESYEFSMNDLADKGYTPAAKAKVWYVPQANHKAIQIRKHS